MLDRKTFHSLARTIHRLYQLDNHTSKIMHDRSGRVRVLVYPAAHDKLEAGHHMIEGHSVEFQYAR